MNNISHTQTHTHILNQIDELEKELEVQKAINLDLKQSINNFKISKLEKKINKQTEKKFKILKKIKSIEYHISNKPIYMVSF